MKILPGEAYPLGATWDGAGVNFAIYSEHCEKIELCLYNSIFSISDSRRIELTEKSGNIWHCYLPWVRPGQLYGYRVYGLYEPENGHRFNPNKVLLDPYAKAVGRDIRWNDSMYGYDIHHDKTDLIIDEEDNAPYAALGCVVDTAFSWGDDTSPKIPWNETIIYETHVKGFTKLFPNIPEELQGTYAAFTTDHVIRYLKDLGVTTIEFLPIHHHTDDHFLEKRKLTNYWGYSTLTYFAPDIRYAIDKHSTDAVNEFKMMVRSLHRAGLEVILDVVYNHTSEGNHVGPTLSMRGIDNKAYYKLNKENNRFNSDYTGCGNTLNMANPQVLQLIMDSLRYWVTEMHVDGFRFDLASALARQLHDVDKLAPFFDIIHQDPILSQVKLIAEPWDLGEGGYQVGNFPILWSEWNGQYRDATRSFWNGSNNNLGEIATRIAGSSDLYSNDGRQPHASINFITCHDGFTMTDLVSYKKKHNEANLENNQDGTDDNLSCNHGEEGPTNNEKIAKKRRKHKRNLITTLFISQGVPMLLSGDELCRTKKGNNNTYCQDNELSWHYYKLDKHKKDFFNFTKKLIKLKRTNGVLKRKVFFKGHQIEGSQFSDITWLTLDGKVFSQEDWNSKKIKDNKFLALLMPEEAVHQVDKEGKGIQSHTLLILINASNKDVTFSLPCHTSTTCDIDNQEVNVKGWFKIIDTSDDLTNDYPQIYLCNEKITLEEHSMIIMGKNKRCELFGRK